MKLKFNIFILLVLIIYVSTKKTKFTTEIKITSNGEEEEEEQKDTNKNKNNTSLESEPEESDKKEEEKNEKKEEKEKEKEEEKKEPIRESKNIQKIIPPDKYVILQAPYQDNEDYIITPIGFGTPVNFIPLQVETTSYKSWIFSSVLNKKSSSAFSYDKTASKSAEEPGEWDTVVDQAGTISGNIIYDKLYLDKFEINHFKFIEAVEFENFKDYKLGKIGLGNCHYADSNKKEFCLLERLKENGSIERRLFSLRELSDTHGELVIGEVSEISRGNDYPLLSVINKEAYENIEDEEFKMSWITKISHMLIHDINIDVKKIFENNIDIEGLVSFDSSCHYIEAPYSYIDLFQEKLFDKYFLNHCRKVNDEGAYIFLCNKDKFEKIKDKIKELNLVFVMNGNGFEIPLEFLFEQTKENDYEFFVHFKDFEQNIWNLGHPFFHFFTIIFDQDNQEIGIDGKQIYFLKEETENAIKNKNQCAPWKIILLVFICFCICGLIFYYFRHCGINIRINKGIPTKMIDLESNDDTFEMNPTSGQHQ